MEYISSEGLEKLKKELEERQITTRQEIVERLDEAKSHGDLSENAEYQAAKEEQAFNEGRVLELEKIIKEATVLKPARKGQKTVRLGSMIEVKLVSGRGDNKKKTFMIVGSQEASPLEGRISNESPLGQAFLEHQVNDIIETETPNGKVKYKIVGIQ